MLDGLSHIKCFPALVYNYTNHQEVSSDSMLTHIKHMPFKALIVVVAVFVVVSLAKSPNCFSITMLYVLHTEVRML